jgi:hypothetical protein
VRSNMNLAALQQQQLHRENEHPAASMSAAHADETAAANMSSSSAVGGHRGSLSHSLVEHQIQSPSAFRAHARHHSANDDLGAAFRDDDGACFSTMFELCLCDGLLRRVGNNHKALACFFSEKKFVSLFSIFNFLFPLTNPVFDACLAFFHSW